VAVSVTGTAEVTAEVVAGNVPVVLPGGIDKVAGTVTCVELLARLIEAAPEPALDRVTVHVLLAPPTTVAGAQFTKEMGIAVGVNVMDATWEEPL
jgi:hypothetical protein